MGHGGGHWGGHHDDDHDPEHELEKFRIVTYDLKYALTKEYYKLQELDEATFILVQTDEKSESGTFEVTKEGFLEFDRPDGEDDLVASYNPEIFEAEFELPVPLTFTTPAVTETLTEWKWIVDYHDYTLVLYHSSSTTPYYLPVCTEDEASFLAVAVVGESAYEICAAVHLDIEDEYED